MKKVSTTKLAFFSFMLVLLCLSATVFGADVNADEDCKKESTCECAPEVKCLVEANKQMRELVAGLTNNSAGNSASTDKVWIQQLLVFAGLASAFIVALILFRSSKNGVFEEKVEVLSKELEGIKESLMGPVINSSFPQYAHAFGGTTVTISGERLNGVIKVTLNGEACETIEVSSGIIKFRTPELALTESQLVDLIVITSLGETGTSVFILVTDLEAQDILIPTDSNSWHEVHGRGFTEDIIIRDLAEKKDADVYYISESKILVKFPIEVQSTYTNFTAIRTDKSVGFRVNYV
jgi:hypothetical protein